jgi:hypothetical protein
MDPIKGYDEWKTATPTYCDEYCDEEEEIFPDGSLIGDDE